MKKQFYTYALLVFTVLACTDRAHKKDATSKLIAKTSNKGATLQNAFIEAQWKLANESLVLEKLTNKLEESTLGLTNISLFKIHTEDQILSNTDFKIVSKISEKELLPADSLPTYSIREEGKALYTVMENAQHGLRIKWSATLRAQSNYIKQQLEVQPIHDSIFIEKITVFDGHLPDATIAGNVLGSPIVSGDFFFGNENPATHSDLLTKTMLRYFHFTDKTGEITPNTHKLLIDIPNEVLKEGAFTVNYLPDNITDQFNIHNIKLLENGKTISEDNHKMYGRVSRPDYRLSLPIKKNTASYSLEVELFGSDKCAGQFFLIKEQKNRLNFYTKKELYLTREKSLKETLVMGISQKKGMRRSFLRYVERERARPYRQFLHYNSWYDLSEDNVSYDLAQAMDVIDGWGEKFIKPYNIDFGGFAFDDGWDDLNDLWRFNKIDFPDGFKPLAEKAQKYNTGIGAWMSPFGGYAEPKKKRIATAVRDGFETSDKGLSLAGPKYYQRFLESALDLIDNNGVNYFKFDGFGGSDPKYLPEMEAATEMVSTLRKANPNVFINVTTGTWPSPFWLMTADCTWRGGWDMQQAGVGNTLQQWITFRDGSLYNNVVRRAPLYPLNSIMIHGIAYANRSLGKKYTTDSDGDFADQVFSYFGSGTALQELYISHDRMNDTKWGLLAKAAKWAKQNEAVLVDTHWVGGDPFNLDVYGWASWNGKKGIVTLRNPADRAQEYILDLANALDTNQEFGKHRVSEPFIKKPTNLTIIDNNVKVILKPFEGKIMEISQ